MEKNFRQYGTTEEAGITTDGGRLVWMHGCNGDYLYVEYPNDFAKERAIIIRGKCDKVSCGSQGGFICDVPDDIVEKSLQKKENSEDE